jgi:DNA-binding GntR family transcriptional regulator
MKKSIWVASSEAQGAGRQLEARRKRHSPEHPMLILTEAPANSTPSEGLLQAWKGALMTTRQASRPRRPRAKGRPKRAQIREQLAELILSGQIPAGVRLHQQELAARFGVAQGVVREALVALSFHGLVDVIDRRGAFVADFDRTRRLEALEVREMLEALAVRRCCERVSRAQIRQLLHLANQIHQCAFAGDALQARDLDRRLHLRLIELSGSATLARQSESYCFCGLFDSPDRDPARVRDEHHAILHAIQAGRADDAELQVRQHIAAARETLRA